MSDLGPSWSNPPVQAQPPLHQSPPDQVPPTPAPRPMPQQQHHLAQSPIGRFEFDGGAASYWGTGLVAFLITFCSLGLLYPMGLVMLERWKAKHTIIDGRRLRFTGTALGLFGHWIKWWFFIAITFGIYALWVRPRVIKWKTERTTYA